MPGTPGTTRRRTRPTVPRWWNTLARKRPSPGTPYTTSASAPRLQRRGRPVREDALRHGLGVGGLHDLERRLAQGSVDAQERPRTDLQVDVGGPFVDGEPEEPVEVQHTSGIDAPRHPCVGPVHPVLVGQARRDRRWATASTMSLPGPPGRRWLRRTGRLADEGGEGRGHRVAEGVEVVATFEEDDQAPGAASSATRRRERCVVARV